MPIKTMVITAKSSTHIGYCLLIFVILFGHFRFVLTLMKVLLKPPRSKAKPIYLGFRQILVKNKHTTGELIMFP